MDDALVAALIEVERHVGRLGWDQPARLFALVRTADLIAAEPHLAEHLGAASPDGFSSVEQEQFHAGDDLGSALARIAWPPTVAGCVLALERAFLPASAEAELPDDLTAAARAVAAHPERMDLRVVGGGTRGGRRHGIARVHADDGELLSGADLVPALAAALAHTLE
jgi:hypothetical protein